MFLISYIYILKYHSKIHDSLRSDATKSDYVRYSSVDFENIYFLSPVLNFTLAIDPLSKNFVGYYECRYQILHSCANLYVMISTDLEGRILQFIKITRTLSSGGEKVFK